jgi:hypothetical protein
MTWKTPIEFGFQLVRSPTSLPEYTKQPYDTSCDTYSFSSRTFSDAGHLIWVLRCERVTQTHRHADQETQTRLELAINERFTNDRSYHLNKDEN